MGNLLGYLIIYISIILGSIFISSIFNKKIESCIGIDIILKMIILYIFGLVGFLEIGTIVISIISIVLGLFAIIKNRKNEDFSSNILTYGILFFTIVYFAFMIFTFNKMSEYWDEYTYWSIYSKKMFYNNQLLNEGLRIIYPPFPTILQYYFNKTVGEYSQGREIFANIVLGISLLLPLFNKIKSEKLLPNIVLMFIIICIPAVFYNIFLYEVIYADAVLGLMIGFFLCNIFNNNNDKFKYFSTMVVLIGISFIKPTGIFISMILILTIVLYWFFKIIYDSKSKKEKIYICIKKDIKKILFIVALICIIIITYSSYLMYSKDFKVYNSVIDQKVEEMLIQEKNSVLETFSTIKTTIFGSNDDSFNDDLSNRLLIKDMLSSTAIKYPVEISLASFIFLYIIGCIIIYKKFYNNDKKFMFFCIAIITGFVIYTAVIQGAYVYQFTATEKIQHMSLDRYLNTYYLGFFIFIISIIIEIIEKDIKQYKLKYIVFLLAIISITQLNIVVDSTVAFGNYNTEREVYLYSYKEPAEFIKSKVPNNSKVYLVNQISNKTATSYEIKYFLYPEIEIDVPFTLGETVTKVYKDFDLYNEWVKLLYNEYDYLYIFKKDAFFSNFAKDLCDNCSIKDKTLYKIEKDDEGNIKLLEIVRENNKGESNEKN